MKKKMVLLVVLLVVAMIPLVVSALADEAKMINETSLSTTATIRYFVSSKGEVSVIYIIRGNSVYEEFQEGGEWQAFVKINCCQWVKGSPLLTSVEDNKLVVSLCIGKEIRKFEFPLLIY